MGLTRLGQGTVAVRGGQEQPLALGAAQVPIFQTAAFAYPDVDTWLDAALGRTEGDIYSRNTNPTVRVFEQKVRLLEGAERATSFASGMAAISNTLFTLLHAIAKQQMSGFGGVLSFSVKGGFEGMKRFLGALRVVHRAASLGSVNTLAGPPATTSHVECTAEERAALGIPEALVRYSCGIENPEDPKRDVASALGQLS